MSWEDSAHEGGLPSGKMRQISSTIFLLSSIFPCRVDVAPSVGFLTIFVSLESL
jgi:hypothetical protein